MSVGRIGQVWAIALGLLFLTISGPAVPQESGDPNTQHVVVVNPIETAKALVARGDYAAAATILDALAQADPKVQAAIDNREVEFLRGQIAFGQGRHEDAARIYRDLLYDDPELTRVRLELGRTLFALRRDDEAEHQFELALSGDSLPNPALDNIEQFLLQISERKVWRTRFSFALVPDSNINQATDAQTVDLFGLPFTLSEDARETSGIGIFSSAGVEWRPRLGKGLRFSADLQGQRTDYEGAAFDDTVASFAVGPEFALGRSYLTLAATGFRRWFGGGAYNAGIGGTATLFVRPLHRLRLRAEVGLRHLEYDLQPERDGAVLGLQINPIFALNSASQLSAVIGFNREFAELTFWRSNAERFGVGYYREMPFGLVAELRPEFVRRRFDALQPAFGRRREDKMLEIATRLQKRDMRIFGLIPTIEILFQRNISNIDLYDFSRLRAQIGLTKRF